MLRNKIKESESREISSQDLAFVANRASWHLIVSFLVPVGVNPKHLVCGPKTKIYIKLNLEKILGNDSKADVQALPGKSWV